MKKYLKEIILSFLLFSIIGYLFIPRFTFSILNRKYLEENKKRNEEFIENQRIIEIKKYLTGKFNPIENEDFILVNKNFTLNEKDIFLRKETYDAFILMAENALIDNIDLKIASGTRNFVYQKNIWENKWNNFHFLNEKDRFKKILEYSAVPGTSRHHWGTDIDINNANPEYFETKEGKKVYDWLLNNAHRFGFCQTYDGKNGLYEEEKWHWSYIPLAQIFLEEYKTLINETEIKGFLGEEYVLDFNLINDYILNINPDCS